MKTEKSMQPIFVAALGVSFFASLDISMKFVAGHYPLVQIVAMRFGTGALFAIIAYLTFGDGMPSRAAIKRNLLRAVVVVGTTSCFFAALARLPLVEAITLTFVAPLLMAVLGRVILKEPVGANTLTGIVIGFAGVLVIARGQVSDSVRGFDLIGLLAALGCAFCYALSTVLMRKQTSHDSMMTIVFLSNCWCLVLVLPLAVWYWQPVLPKDWLAVTWAGLFGTLANFCMAWAYARAPAGRLAILEYLALVWAMIFGYLIFTEVPTNWTLAGTALIIAACLFTTFARRSGA